MPSYGISGTFVPEIANITSGILMVAVCWFRAAPWEFCCNRCVCVTPRSKEPPWPPCVDLFSICNGLLWIYIYVSFDTCLCLFWYTLVSIGRTKAPPYRNLSRVRTQQIQYKVVLSFFLSWVANPNLITWIQETVTDLFWSSSWPHCPPHNSFVEDSHSKRLNLDYRVSFQWFKAGFEYHWPRFQRWSVGNSWCPNSFSKSISISRFWINSLDDNLVNFPHAPISVLVILTALHLTTGCTRTPTSVWTVVKTHIFWMIFHWNSMIGIFF